MIANLPPEPGEPAQLEAAAPSSSRHRRLLRWAAVLACVVLLFYAVMGYISTAALFGENPRWRGMNRGPKDFGLAGETVTLQSTDGLMLKAWWLPANGEPRGDVIIAHGIDHTRQVMLPRAVFLVRGGYNVLALDLRGHGESESRAVSPGFLEARDILGAVNYLRWRGEREPIVVLGVSYGAAAAVLAAAQSQQIAAVIADGVFPSGAAVAGNISRHVVADARSNVWLQTAARIDSLPCLPMAIALVYWARTGVYLGSDLLNVIPYAARVRVPVLFISGGSDWIVPTEQERKVMAAIPGDRKSMLVIPGAQHDTTFSTDPSRYRDAVLDFLGRNLPLQSEPRP